MDVQVAAVNTSDKDVQPDTDIQELLNFAPASMLGESFAQEQSKDQDIQDIASYIAREQLPDCPLKARKLAAKAQQFTLLDGIVYFLDSKRGGRKRCVVPKHLRQSIIEENHSGPMAGHFAGDHLYKALSRHWWWPNTYSDVSNHCLSCPQCAIVNSSGR